MNIKNQPETPNEYCIMIFYCSSCAKIFINGKWLDPSEERKIILEKMIANCPCCYRYCYTECPDCKKNSSILESKEKIKAQS